MLRVHLPVARRPSSRSSFTEPTGRPRRGLYAERRYGWLAACLAFLATYPATAQTEIGVLSEPTRAMQERYSIELEQIAAIGTFDGEGAIEKTTLLRRTATGLFLVGQRDHIKVFDSAGRYVRTLGRRGSGPNEFRRIVSIVVARGDTVHVFDQQNLRHSVMTTDGRVVRSSRIPQYLNEATITTDGKVVLNQAIRTPDRVGYPLHFISDGRVTKSFGMSNPVVRPDAMSQFRRSIAPTDQGGLWTARYDQYLIEHFDSTGAFVAGFTRRMRLYTQTGQGTGQAPGTSTAAIAAPGSDSVWILIVTPDPEWREAVTWGKHPDGPGRYTVEDYNGVYDTVIDVVDAATGRVLASRRVDVYLQDFAGSGLMAYGYSVSQDGTPQIAVWQLHLSESGKRPSP